jgi:hypothetical protein
MNAQAQSLEKIVKKSADLKQIRKSEVHYGDCLQIYTLNSQYTLRVLNNDYYLVSGGWFDQKDVSPTIIKIRGCTWGASIIKIDILAACGLCIEFTNRVVTSTIQKVILKRYNFQN